jgi:DNA-binding transcriptional LysR family regulator
MGRLIMPLVLAGSGAALLPEPLAEEAEKRGAVVTPTTPAIERRIDIVHRADRLSPRRLPRRQPRR